MTDDKRQVINSSYFQIVAGLATLLTFGLAIQQAGVMVLDVDELYEVTLVAQPSLELLANYRVSSQLIHVFITKIFAAVCWDILCLRLPSIIAGTLAIPLIYRLGCDLFDRRIGALSAFMLTITLTHIRYSSFIRGYALMVALSLAGIYFFTRALQTNRRRWWAAFILVSVLNIYNQVFAIFLMLPLVIFAVGWLWRVRKQSFNQLKQYLQNIVLAGGVALLLLLPMFFLVVRQQSSSDNLAVLFSTDWPTSFPPVTLEQPLNILAPLIQMSYDFSPTHRPGWPTILFVGFLIVGIVEGLQQPRYRRKVVLLLLILLVPPLAMTGAATIFQPWFWGFRRFLLFVMIPYLLLASAGLVFLTTFLSRIFSAYVTGRQTGRIYAAILLLLLLPATLPVISHLTAPPGRPPKPYAIGRYLQEQVGASDLILCVPDQDWRVTSGRENCSLTLNLHRNLAPHTYYLDQLADYEILQAFLKPDTSCQNRYVHLPHPHFEIECHTGSPSRPANIWLVMWRSRDITVDAALTDSPHPATRRSFTGTDILYVDKRNTLVDTLIRAGEIALQESKTPLRKFENYISLATVYLAAGRVEQALTTLDEAAFVSRWPDAVERLAILQAQLSHLPLPLEPRYPADVTWNHQIRLIGLDQDLTAPGDSLQISTYWQLLKPVSINYQILLHLLNEEGAPVATFDYQPFDGQRPLSTWEPGRIIRETRTIDLPSDLPPGAYSLVVGVYHPETLERLPITIPNNPGDEWILAEWMIN